MCVCVKIKRYKVINLRLSIYGKNGKSNSTFQLEKQQVLYDNQHVFSISSKTLISKLKPYHIYIKFYYIYFLIF